MTPYYSEGGIDIYHGDNRVVLPELPLADLLLTDPPYGLGAARRNFGGQGVRRHMTGLVAGKAIAKRDYGDSDWDDVPADAATLQLAMERTRYHIVFGGNYFDLGPSRCYLVWDKLRGETDYADAELAWTNLDRAVRVIRWKWNGFLQQNSGKDKEERFHPTQKPLSVMIWALNQAPDDCRSLLDPWAGSGTTLVAAKRLGRVATGIEIEERYCEMAAKRLSQSVLDFDAAAPPPYAVPGQPFCRYGSTMKPFYEEAGVTIYCGDCRDVLPSLSADVVITDPPYGVNLGLYTGTSRYTNTPYLSTEDTPEYIQQVCVPVIEKCLTLARRLAMTPGNRCMWAYPKPDDVGIWYNPASTNRGRWGFSHANAFIFFYGKDPYNIGKGMLPNSVSGHCDSVAGIDHPCPKPLKFMRWMVGRVSLPGESILDPFMGSGTTLVAAKHLGRKAIGIEIEERYCELAAKRLSQGVLELDEKPA